LHDARVSEIFVVYHDGSLRVYDITEVSRGPHRLGDVECPPAAGVRLVSDTVCMEIRDRGLAWKDDTGARRGQELVLWSIIDATNYKYVVEWTFRDDGIIVGRVGATGRNHPHAHDVSHTHNVMWRLDLDLDGALGDSVYFSRHLERKDSETAREREVLVARERGIPWVATQFTTLSVYDAALLNSQGKRSAYRLIPWRLGSARHVEAFTQSDFWVTRSQGKGTQMLAREIPSYIVPAEDVVDTDVVAWYTGSVLHIERDEDDSGPTQAMWVGFMLQPHDLFDQSPLYP
jgi:primary-amine oxidase